MKNYKLRLSYDGTHFFGWQKTKMGPSIEETLEKVLTQLVQHPVTLQAASRTDRGVHALDQCVNFFSNKAVALHAINALLPPTIRGLSINEVAPSFHPTLDVKEKEYRYHLVTTSIQSPFCQRSWHRPSIDVVKLKEAACTLEGTHCFKALCNQRKGNRYQDYVRTVHRVEVFENKGELIVSMHADRFLYKMARNIVGLMVGYSEGKLTESIPAILASQDRKKGYITAPACGLFLYRISYLGCGTRGSIR